MVQFAETSERPGLVVQLLAMRADMMADRCKIMRNELSLRPFPQTTETTQMILKKCKLGLRVGKVASQRWAGKRMDHIMEF